MQKQSAFTNVVVRIAFVVLLFIATTMQAGVREVGPIGLTVDELDRVLPFYTKTLTFGLKNITTADGSEQDALLGLDGTATRSAELLLGAERIILSEHITNKGRPIPPDSRSFDHWFQHIAIVVSDMDRAYAHLRRAKVKHVSTLPQTLPAWNKDAGGIKAFYFRDPENHVLEIIWFPPGKGDPKWQQATTNLFLGIVHTAIVVSETDRSLVFYTNVLGLHVAAAAENYGTEQEHLNQVFGARLRITALRAARGPGIEFLEYITPPGGRPLWPDARANDLVFWNAHLVVDDLPGLSAKLRQHGASFVSRSNSMRSQIVRDPDGHALQLDAMRAVASIVK